MAQAFAIPGRRIQDGETFYTDWVPRGGDCILLRIEILIDGGVGADKMTIGLETRGEDGSTATPITPTSPSGTFIRDSVGVGTALYLATDSIIAGNGAQEQVRVKVQSNGGGGGYYVVRLFPLIFFDSAKPY